MDRRRLLFIGMAALVMGGLISSAVYRSLQRRMIPQKPGVQ
jgi:hypothetical protein